MEYELNPFQELYVTDSPDTRTFVELFSNVPITHAQALFKPGNVVVRGMQGTGKSMLLNLLRPQIRIAYHQAGEEFPVPRQLREFIGAGINLTRSGILDIGQRSLRDNLARDTAIFPFYFADFLNYFVVQDILSTVEAMGANPDAFNNLVDAGQLDDFAAMLAADDCWFGFFDNCRTFRDLRSAINERLSLYRKFHQTNIDALPTAVHETKTAIGAPIARAEAALKSSGVVAQAVPLFVRIDQIERLFRSDVLRPDLGKQYRRVINKALSLRDSRVSYCVGVRTYAWNDDLTIFETDDKIEHIRDFRFIDLDELLRRKENVTTWVFPKFAEDVFARRLKHAGYTTLPRKHPVRQVFGASNLASGVVDQISQYATNLEADQFLDIEGWPKAWKDFLTELFADDPVEARLAQAWARQRGRAGNRGERLEEPPPAEGRPWRKPYWRKDRDRMALRQLEARSAQRSKWYGEKSVLSLSGGNITIFISICHEIWDSFLRSQRRKTLSEKIDPVAQGISPDIQSAGIQTASAYWFDKIAEQPGGSDRQRFIAVLGRQFREWLVADNQLSYPGHNGFSISEVELRRSEPIARYLREAADYGDLYEATHTTKERDRVRRTKWYLMPILSEYFQISDSHTREPFYATIKNVADWLRQADIFLKDVRYIDREAVPEQRGDVSLPLFDNLDE